MQAVFCCKQLRYLDWFCRTCFFLLGCPENLVSRNPKTVCWSDNPEILLNCRLLETRTLSRTTLAAHAPLLELSSQSRLCLCHSPGAPFTVLHHLFPWSHSRFYTLGSPLAPQQAPKQSCSSSALEYGVDWLGWGSALQMTSVTHFMLRLRE